MIPKDTPQSETTCKIPEPIKASEHKWVNSIPQSEPKAFDITKHQWSDGIFTNPSYDEECVHLDVNSEYLGTINKDDAIAIAKHFGIIKEVKSNG